MRAMNFIMQIKNGVVCLQELKTRYTHFHFHHLRRKIYFMIRKCNTVHRYTYKCYHSRMAWHCIPNMPERYDVQATQMRRSEQKKNNILPPILDSPRKRVAKQFTQSLNLLPLISFYDRLATLMNLEDNNLMFGKLFFFSTRVMAMDKVYITKQKWSVVFYLEFDMLGIVEFALLMVGKW